MHYTFIIVGRKGQIDFHYEPSPVFSNYDSNYYYNPAVLGDSSMFPYENGMIERMINKFQLREYCGKALGVIIVRVNESNSANYGGTPVENSMLTEFAALGFNPLIIDSEQLSNYQVHEISLLGSQTGHPSL